MPLFGKKKYQVEIEGRNFLVLWDEAPKKYGFHTTRYVAAKNEAEAESATVALLTHEFKKFVLNATEDKPMIRVVAATAIESFGSHEVPGQGAEWYLE